MKKLLIAAFLIVSAVTAQAQDINSYIELLRSDLNTQKKEIITEVMQFTDGESETFWKIYNSFENDFRKLGDKRVAMIKKYAENYDTMNDEMAEKLIDSAFDYRSDRLKLKRDLWKKLKDGIGAARAAKFIQLDNMIQLLIDVQISSELPFFEKVEEAQDSDKK
ncbi:MAG: hypothetical protein GXO87_00215 [Chlorobi bacterium]|nr:hypothetical protein [Chlorobiota bacterium]